MYPVDIDIISASSTVTDLNGLKCISSLSPQSTFTCRLRVWSSLSCRRLLISTPGYECLSSKPPGPSFSTALGKTWMTSSLTWRRGCSTTRRRFSLKRCLNSHRVSLRVRLSSKSKRVVSGVEKSIQFCFLYLALFCCR